MNPRIAILSLALPLASACKGGAISLQDDTGEITGPLEEVCNDGTQWAPRTTAFKAATSSWGLGDIEATGVNLSAIDFDGDGWTDLMVRQGNGPDDFAQGMRNTWLLRNTGAGSFEDVTYESGLFRGRENNPDLGLSGNVYVFGDVDNDGDLDVYTGLRDPGGTSPATSELRINNGDGTFSLSDDQAVRYGPGDNPYSASWVDVDRDGWLDLWNVQYGPAQDRLYRGQGDGELREEAWTMGLSTRPWSTIEDANNALSHSQGYGALACDLNNDGAPELLASSYARAPNHLWQNDGAGEFVNHSIASGYAFDDNQDWTDNTSARCWCKLHPDDEDCEGVPEPFHTCEDESDVWRWSHSSGRETYTLGGNSATTACADLDNDGWMDLLTTEITHWDIGESGDHSELLMNTGSGDVTFTRRPASETGLSRYIPENNWDYGDLSAAVFDFDNDGWQDIWIGVSDYDDNVGLLWHAVGDGDFETVPPSEGIDHARALGVAVADFDRDGDLDLVAGHSPIRCNDDDCYEDFSIRYFENLIGQDGNFLQLSLEGSGGSNRSAIGARVSVNAGGVTQTQEVSGGYGLGGIQNDLALHFGLGEACSAEVTVRWPDADGTTETFTLGGGYRYQLTQGGAPVADSR